MKRRLWPLLLASAIGLAILLTLGTWQVQRLAWKRDLIAQIDGRMAAQPRELETFLFPQVSSTVLPEHTKVKAYGTFLDQAPYRFMASVNRGPGWRLVHLFETRGGAILFVERGVLPEGAVAKDVTGEVRIEGIINWHDRGYGFFDPANDVAGNRWYRWDWSQLLGDAAGKLSATGKKPFGPFVVRLLPNSAGTQGLVVSLPKADLRNNHLGYAITWFGLAAVLVVMTAVFIWRTREKK